MAAGWWNDAVFYEIFVRSFADSDGDGKGDFKGLTSKLDYLEELGVTGLWLMPIHPSTSYHGYDVTDYYGVNPDYGTLDDFKQFLSEARRRGIKVIIDFVINHTSSEHPWFQASQDPKSDKRDWYVWSDAKPDYAGPWNQPVWHEGESGYYYGVFWEGMPDLNLRNPDVTAQIEDIARFWLEDVGVDGFRVDGARHLIEDGAKQVNTPDTHAWFKQFHDFYKSVNPDAMTVGEVWDSVVVAAPYVRDGEMDLVFNFELASTYMDGVNGRSGDKIRTSASDILGRLPPGQYGSFLTNHDQNRVMSQFAGDAAKARSAAVLYLTGPGTPFIYYGEEIGMTGAKPDEKIRTPMQWSAEANAGFTSGTPWIAVNEDYPQKNVAAQSAVPDSLLSLYRRLIALRNEHPALRSGDYTLVDAGHKSVYAALRATEDEAVLVLQNLGDQPVADYKLKLAGSLLRGRYTLAPLLGEGEFAQLDVDAGGGFADYQPLPELKPGAAYVLLLKPAS